VKRQLIEALLACERLGKDPDPNKVPMDMGSFPYEVQLAFLIHDLLSDRWEGMSGSYLGKDWSAVGVLLDSYNIDTDRQTVLFFIKAIDNINSNIVNKNIQKEQKKEERSSKGNMNFPKGK